MLKNVHGRDSETSRRADNCAIELNCLTISASLRKSGWRIFFLWPIALLGFGGGSAGERTLLWTRELGIRVWDKLNLWRKTELDVRRQGRSRLIPDAEAEKVRARQHLPHVQRHHGTDPRHSRAGDLRGRRFRHRRRMPARGQLRRRGRVGGSEVLHARVRSCFGSLRLLSAVFVCYWQAVIGNRRIIGNLRHLYRLSNSCVRAVRSGSKSREL